MFQAINILHQGLPKLITRDRNHGILPPKLRPQAIIQCLMAKSYRHGDSDLEFYLVPHITNGIYIIQLKVIFAAAQDGQLPVS